MSEKVLGFKKEDADLYLVVMKDKRLSKKNKEFYRIKIDSNKLVPVVSVEWVKERLEDLIKDLQPQQATNTYWIQLRLNAIIEAVEKEAKK